MTWADVAMAAICLGAACLYIWLLTRTPYTEEDAVASICEREYQFTSYETKLVPAPEGEGGPELFDRLPQIPVSAIMPKVKAPKDSTGHEEHDPGDEQPQR